MAARHRGAGHRGPAASATPRQRGTVERGAGDDRAAAVRSGAAARRPVRRLPGDRRDPDRLEPRGRARLAVPAVGADPVIDARTVTRDRSARGAGGVDTGVDIADPLRRAGDRLPDRDVAAVRPTTRSCSATSTPTRRSRTPRQFPTVAVYSGMEKNPQMIMWDPATYPDVAHHRRPRHGRRARSATSAARRTWSTSSRAASCRADQVDGSYDGTPAAFVAAGGADAQQGFGSAEPYIYEHEVAGLDEAGRLPVHQRRRLGELRRVDRVDAGEPRAVRRLLRPAGADHPAVERSTTSPTRPRPTS